MVCSLPKQYKNLSLSGLTVYALLNPSFWIDTINLGVSIVYMEGTWVITTKLF